jgi:hypothetical protein
MPDRPQAPKHADRHGNSADRKSPADRRSAVETAIEIAKERSNAWKDAQGTRRKSDRRAAHA